MENPIKMDDLGVPIFLETPILLESNFFFLAILMYCNYYVVKIIQNPKNQNVLPVDALYKIKSRTKTDGRSASIYVHLFQLLRYLI